MDIRKLQRAIVDGLEDVKAQNIVVFNTEHLSPLFERVIIASGTSNRQTKALASSVRDAVKKRGLQVMRTEGEDNGEWIIVDCGAAVAHIMQPAIREYYHLEEIWGGKPVKLKLDGEAKGLVKASGSDEDDEEPAPPARKQAAKKSATAQTPAGKTATKTPARAAGKASAGKTADKPPARKAAPAKAPAKTAARKTAASAGPAAKSPARKAPAKKAAITRTVGVKKAPAKAAAGKTAAKKTAPRR